MGKSRGGSLDDADYALGQRVTRFVPNTSAANGKVLVPSGSGAPTDIRYTTLAITSTSGARTGST